MLLIHLLKILSLTHIENSFKTASKIKLQFVFGSHNTESEHCLYDLGSVHCLFDLGSVHCLYDLKSVHCLYDLGSVHCLHDLGLVHYIYMM